MRWGRKEKEADERCVDAERLAAGNGGQTVDGIIGGQTSSAGQHQNSSKDRSPYLLRILGILLRRLPS